MESRLVEMCIDSACRSRVSIDKWRRQTRTLHRLPSHLADELIRRLHTRRLLYPSLLEVFKFSIEEINFSGDHAVDAEWMAYLGAFSSLRYLNLADCHRITSSAVWSISGMASLKELDLSRCLKLTDTGIMHLISISTLEKLSISETRVTSHGIKLLASLKQLSFLDLGGLPVTDQSLSCLQVLKNLKYLDLWGSKITDQGSIVLQKFTMLSFLSLAWTSVTQLPKLPSLEILNMSNCTINSSQNGFCTKAPLQKLIVAGATFMNEDEILGSIEAISLCILDVSNSSLRSFSFLPQMKALQHLDLSSTMIENDSMELLVFIGASLKTLNLSNTKVNSLGVGILAGEVPNLETISLAHTPIDDAAIICISRMPSLKAIDLNSTNIKGIIPQYGTKPEYLSFTALQELRSLEVLNLEQTQVRDGALSALSSLKELRNVSLKSASLTDSALYYLSSIPKLASLGIRDAVLTDSALDFLKPPSTLMKIDFRGCWLLTGDAILAFGRRFPQIQVMHELSPPSPSTHTGHSKSTRFGSRVSKVKQKNRETQISQSFIDQRFKYNRGELLALQYSSVCPISADARAALLNEMESGSHSEECERMFEKGMKHILDANEVQTNFHKFIVESHLYCHGF